MDQKHGAQTAWAKAQDGVPTLTLVDHSIDVAAVAEALLRLPTVADRLSRLAESELTAVDRARLAFFIGLHDVGKANSGFQRKLRSQKPSAGHIGPIWDILCGHLVYKDHRRLRNAVGKAIASRPWMRWGIERRAIWDAVLAHHGSLPSRMSSQPDVRLWQTRNGYNPIAAIEKVAGVMKEMFPAAFIEGHQTKWVGQSRFMHALAGLITLADWLGSDVSVFPADSSTVPTGAARIEWARKQAGELLRRRWLDPTRAREAANNLELDFKKLFPEHSDSGPTPSQAAMLDGPLPNPGQATVLEAETGSGKTEAALIHFLRLFREGKVDGLYFALPTRAASVQIHGRIQRLLRRWLGEAAPPVGLAVPGYLRVDESRGQRLPEPYRYLWPDEKDRDRTWAVEHTKRYLAGAVMVGTIDQVLIGGLRTRHAQLRSSLMLRLLLCVDEVHASDGYMNVLLRNILDQHAKAGGYALLMSATLGAWARMRLLRGRVEAHEAPTIDAAVAQPYPSVTRSGMVMCPLVRIGREKRVSVELLDPESNLESLWERLKDAAESGAAVLFIRNRVDDACSAVRELEERAVRVLHCQGVAAPHHGRFASEDRRLLDTALEEAFSGGNRTGVVAVTTQTAEQSLDICADWLVTDIAPGDVLLQRIGRLHRHKRDRPAGFETAQVTVLAPSVERLERTVNRRTGEPHGKTALGIGSVYENMVGILAVRDWLDQHCEIHIPSDNRALVEASTHRDVLQDRALPPGSIWHTHLQYDYGCNLAIEQGAGNVTIRWGESLAEAQPVSDIRAETRLGLKDHRVVFSTPQRGPFGHDVQSFSIPGWMAKAEEEDLEPENIRYESGLIRFRYGSHEYCYDRFGLSRADQ